MAYIYRYTDKNDGLVKYVGIIKNENNFPKRFKQHTGDYWYNDGDWLIEYAEVATQTDAEALEAHLITVYGTDDYYNRAKAKWGLCSFAPNVKNLHWRVFKEEADTGRPNRYNALDVLEVQIAKTQSLEDHLSDVQNKLLDLQDDIKKYAKASIREWYKAKGEEAIEKRGSLTNAECFKSYNRFRTWHNSDLYEFLDEEDFQIVIEEMYEWYKPRVTREELYSELACMKILKEVI